MASDIGAPVDSDDFDEFVLMLDEKTVDLPRLPHELRQEIFINIRDRDALYNTLYAHGFVAIDAGVLDEHEIVGDHWNLPFVGPGHPYSVDAFHIAPSSSSSSSSSTPLRSILRRNVHTGQILYGYADMYYSLLVKDVKSGALRDLRELGRDIYVRLRGDTTLKHMVEDPEILAALHGNWAMRLDAFVGSFSNIQYKCSRIWADIVGRALHQHARAMSQVHRVVVPHHIPPHFVTLMAANMKPRNFINAFWLRQIASRERGASGSVLDLVRQMDDRSYITHANVRTADLHTENGRIHRVRVSVWTEVVQLVDLMLRHNEYVVTNNMKWWMFSVTTVCRIISMAFLEQKPSRRGYTTATRSFAGWDCVIDVLFDAHTNLYNRMMTYLYIPEYGPAGFEAEHSAREWEMGKVEGMLHDADSFHNNALGIYCLPILMRAIANTEAATMTTAPLYYIATIATMVQDTMSVTTEQEREIYASSESPHRALGRDISDAARDARVRLREIEQNVAGRSSDEIYVQHMYGDDADDLEDALYFGEGHDPEIVFDGMNDGDH